MKLSAWRTSRGWTQQQVADAVDCVVSSIARYENGSRNPEPETLKRVYILTRGEVQPNDFYDVPTWQAELIRIEAEAELARQAA